MLTDNCLSGAPRLSLPPKPDLHGRCKPYHFLLQQNDLHKMQRGRARPDPVSCQSCRSKKLKCNRVQPCSNCAARSIPCNFLVPPPRESNAELIARIERLESIVLRQSGSFHTSSQVHLDVTSQQLLSPRSGSNAVFNSHHGRDQDSRLLEEIGTREDSLVGDSRPGRFQRYLSINILFSSQLR